MGNSNMDYDFCVAGVLFYRLYLQSRELVRNFWYGTPGNRILIAAEFYCHLQIYLAVRLFLGERFSFLVISILLTMGTGGPYPAV
jgi:hypothetical protein